MPSTQGPVIEPLIDSLSPIVTMERDGLVVIALGSSRHMAPPAYLTLEEAVGAHQVDVHEVGSGSVPTVAVETKTQPVVLFAGDTIVGGKQHRVVNVTIWLKPGRTTPIPVTCLEHGRWDPGKNMSFRSGPRADLRLRSMMNAQVYGQVRESAAVGGESSAPYRFAADQQGVWREIDAKQARAASTSPTHALHDLYELERVDVAALERAFPYPDGAIGAAIAIGGRLTALELHDQAASARRLWSRLVQGAIRAHLDHRRMVAMGDAPKAAHRFPDRGALGRLFERVRAAQPDALSTPGVGEGTDVRFGTDRITGAALVRDGQVVHLEVHRVGA
jgi:hypothetical protein